MKAKTKCTKTIIFTRKDLIKKLGLSGKITDISVTRRFYPFDMIGHDDGIEVTLLVSEEKEWQNTLK